MSTEYGSLSPMQYLENSRHIVHLSISLIVGGSHYAMPLYRFIKLMLVAPVDFFSGRELYGCNLIACVCVYFVFVLTFFYYMDYWSPR